MLRDLINETRESRNEAVGEDIKELDHPNLKDGEGNVRVMHNIRIVLEELQHAMRNGQHLSDVLKSYSELVVMVLEGAALLGLSRHLPQGMLKYQSLRYRYLNDTVFDDEEEWRDLVDNLEALAQAHTITGENFVATASFPGAVVQFFYRVEYPDGPHAISARAIIPDIGDCGIDMSTHGLHEVARRWMDKEVQALPGVDYDRAISITPISPSEFENILNDI